MSSLFNRITPSKTMDNVVQPVTQSLTQPMDDVFHKHKYVINNGTVAWKFITDAIKTALGENSNIVHTLDDVLCHQDASFIESVHHVAPELDVVENTPMVAVVNAKRSKFYKGIDHEIIKIYSNTIRPDGYFISADTVEGKPANTTYYVEYFHNKFARTKFTLRGHITQKINEFLEQLGKYPYGIDNKNWENDKIAIKDIHNKMLNDFDQFMANANSITTKDLSDSLITQPRTCELVLLHNLLDEYGIPLSFFIGSEQNKIDLLKAMLTVTNTHNNAETMVNIKHNMRCMVSNRMLAQHKLNLRILDDFMGVFYELIAVARKEIDVQAKPQSSYAIELPDGTLKPIEFIMMMDEKVLDEVMKRNNGQNRPYFKIGKMTGQRVIGYVDTSLYRTGLVPKGGCEHVAIENLTNDNSPKLPSPDKLLTNAMKDLYLSHHENPNMKSLNKLENILELMERSQIIQPELKTNSNTGEQIVTSRPIIIKDVVYIDLPDIKNKNNDGAYDGMTNVGNNVCVVHRRKQMHGTLEGDRSGVFRGPSGVLQNIECMYTRMGFEMDSLSGFTNLDSNNTYMSAKIACALASGNNNIKSNIPKKDGNGERSEMDESSETVFEQSNDDEKFEKFITSLSNNNNNNNNNKTSESELTGLQMCNNNMVGLLNTMPKQVTVVEPNLKKHILNFGNKEYNIALAQEYLFLGQTAANEIAKRYNMSNKLITSKKIDTALFQTCQLMRSEHKLRINAAKILFNEYFTDISTRNGYPALGYANPLIRNLAVSPAYDYFSVLPPNNIKNNGDKTYEMIHKPKQYLGCMVPAVDVSYDKFIALATHMTKYVQAKKLRLVINEFEKLYSIFHLRDDNDDVEDEMDLDVTPKDSDSDDDSNDDDGDDNDDIDDEKYDMKLNLKYITYNCTTGAIKFHGNNIEINEKTMINFCNKVTHLMSSLRGMSQAHNGKYIHPIFNTNKNTHKLIIFLFGALCVASDYKIYFRRSMEKNEHTNKLDQIITIKFRKGAMETYKCLLNSPLFPESFVNDMVDENRKNRYRDYNNEFKRRMSKANGDVDDHDAFRFAHMITFAHNMQYAKEKCRTPFIQFMTFLAMSFYTTPDTISLLHCHDYITMIPFDCFTAVLIDNYSSHITSPGAFDEIANGRTEQNMVKNPINGDLTMYVRSGYQFARNALNASVITLDMCTLSPETSKDNVTAENEVYNSQGMMTRRGFNNIHEYIDHQNSFIDDLRDQAENTLDNCAINFDRTFMTNILIPRYFKFVKKTYINRGKNEDTCSTAAVNKGIKNGYAFLANPCTDVPNKQHCFMGHERATEADTIPSGLKANATLTHQSIAARLNDRLNAEPATSTFQSSQSVYGRNIHGCLSMEFTQTLSLVNEMNELEELTLSGVDTFAINPNNNFMNIGGNNADDENSPCSQNNVHSLTDQSLHESYKIDTNYISSNSDNEQDNLTQSFIHLAKKNNIDINPGFTYHFRPKNAEHLNNMTKMNRSTSLAAGMAFPHTAYNNVDLYKSSHYEQRLFNADKNLGNFGRSN